MTGNAALQALHKARRPLLLYGWGIRLAGAQREAQRLADLLGIPILTTWGAADLFPGAVGSFGTHGVKAANLAVQNADWILSVGTRLDTKATGSPASSFAPKAEFFMVDIDHAELGKMEKIGRPVNGLHMDAKAYLGWMVGQVEAVLQHEGSFPDFSVWRAQIKTWKEVYPVVKPEWREDRHINPYVFVESLSDHLSPDDVIVSDTGCVLGWMMQAYKFKGERFVHAFNNTPMGYGLPGAVGAALATASRVVLVTGDGGLAVNITELATLRHHSLPVKIILFNNKGHAMCRQTQRQWLKGEYPATSEEGGLACPDYAEVAKAYRLDTYRASWFDQSMNVLQRMFERDGPGFLELEINPDHGIVGQIKFGEPLAEAA